MAETGFWVQRLKPEHTNLQVNPFQILRLNSKDEMQRPVEFTSQEAGGDDGCCENGDKSIFRNCSPRSQTKAIPVPASHNIARGHSFTQISETVSPKGTNYSLSEKLTMLAQLATTPSKDTSYLKMLDPKCLVDAPKSQKRHLKRSLSFNNNHSSRPTSPRQTTSQSSYIDVAEILATSVSIVREHNRKLETGVEVKKEGSYSENDIDEYSCDEDENDLQQNEDLMQFDSQIEELEYQLQAMGSKFNEQLEGRAALIEELKSSLRKAEKEVKRKSAEITRLEGDLENSRQAIAELFQHVQHGAAYESSQNPETIRQLEAELREKDKAIEELTKRITVSSRQASELREKEKKLEALVNQVAHYQSLEIEWNAKQEAFEGLSSQFEKLQSYEAELSEKNAMIESLTIRVETSQRVIAELREKHAPNDLLRQLRQKDYIIDNLTEQVENIDADLKDKDDEIETLTGKLAEDAKLMEKQNSQLISLRKRMEDAESKNSKIHQQLAEKERLLSNLEAKYRDISRNNENGAEKICAQENTIAMLRQEALELRRDLTIQSSQNRDKERIIMSTREETANIRANFQGLLNALSEKEQKIQLLDQHIESLQQQAAAAALKVGAKDQNKGKNEARLNALQKVLNAKNEACKDYERKISQLEEEFSNLKKTMDDGKTANSEKEIKIQRLVKINRELKEEVTRLKENIEAKEKELVTIKSRIPHPVPGSAPAASVRTPKSARSSMYGFSGGESSSDEAGRHVKAASIHGYPSALRRSGVTASTTASRRLSDVSKVSRVSTTSLTRPKSTISTLSQDAALRKKAAMTQLAAKREVKPRKPTTPSTVEVLKKKSPATTKDASPINRLAVDQRKRDMGVIINMHSGVAPDRKNRVSTLAQKRSTATSSLASTIGEKKKLAYNNTSSDSDSERKQPTRKSSSNLATIMEKIRKNDGSTATGTISATKTRAPLTRPLPRKSSSTA